MIKQLAACALAGAAISPTWASSSYVDLGTLVPDSGTLSYDGLADGGPGAMDYLYFRVSSATRSLTFDYGPGQSQGIADLAWWELWSNPAGQLSSHSDSDWQRLASGAAEGSEILSVTADHAFEEGKLYKLRLGFNEADCCSRDYAVRLSGVPAVIPVPEASTWAMMTAGLAMLTLWSRRRRQRG
ncbi:MAG: PEP-CTERM sorting domain-containing protein [Burkholderiaceae bacterium]